MTLSKRLMDSHMREKIEYIVNQAIENKPIDATNIRIIEKRVYNSKENWYENNIFARYDTPTGQFDIEIEKVGDWMYTEPSNYLLYRLNEYHPYSSENRDVIQGRYERFLDDGLINEPIMDITSPKWEFKALCEKIIQNNIDNIKITLLFDENELHNQNFDMVDYRCHWDDLKLKEYYCAKITIEYEEQKYTTNGGFYSEYISWINKFSNALNNHNISHTIDITDNDYKKWCKYHNWNDLEFDDCRFDL